MESDVVGSTLIVAHRGETTGARENTLEAFAQALELGADMIELDVRKSSDGVLLVHHDDCITVGKKVHLLHDIDYQSLNRLIDYNVPRLEEVLSDFGSIARFDIELKETGYEEYFLKSVLKHLKEDRFVCTSFNELSVKAIKKITRKVRVGLLLGIDDPGSTLGTRVSEYFPWGRFERCHADFLAPHYRFVNFLFLRTAAKKKIPLYVWTVNQDRLIEKFCHNQVEAVITDQLKLALAIRDNR